MTEIRFRVAIALAVLLALSGCATTHPMMPTPVMYTGAQAKPLFTDAPAVARTSPLELLYFTDRALAQPASEVQPYTSGRSRSEAFGSTTILFGDDMPQGGRHPTITCATFSFSSSIRSRRCPTTGISTRIRPRCSTS